MRITTSSTRDLWRSVMIGSAVYAGFQSEPPYVGCYAGRIARPSLVLTWSPSCENLAAMKKVTASNTARGIGRAGKNGKAHSTKAGVAKSGIKHPDFFANLERLGYPETVGARMLKKFHDSLS